MTYFHFLNVLNHQPHNIHIATKMIFSWTKCGQPICAVQLNSNPLILYFHLQAVQQKPATLTRQTTLKESDVAALIKLQQQRQLAQNKLKGTITTLPVSGVKVSSVPMQVRLSTVSYRHPMACFLIKSGVGYVYLCINWQICLHSRIPVGVYL